MSSSNQFLELCIELKEMLNELDAIRGKDNKSIVCFNVLTHVLNNMSIIKTEIHSSESQPKLLKLVLTMYEKCFQLHNDMVKYNVGSFEKNKVCKDLELVLRKLLLNTFKIDKNDDIFDQYFVESPYVRRSARLSAKITSAIKPGGAFPYPGHTSAVKPGGAFPLSNALENNGVEIFFNPYDHIPPLRRSARLLAKAAR